MAEPKIPEAKDDDPEDVSDKLSIASAMWGRGDRADAVNWLRRAAEAASDADLDLRALELAKMASELTSLVEPAATQTGAPPRPPSTSAPAISKTAPTAAPVAPAPAPTAAPPNKPPPKPSVRPPSSRPPGGKLPPLPPLRPLGSQPAAPPQQPKAPAPRVPSMLSSVSGMASASGTIEREPELPKQQPQPAAASENPTAPMPWDERDEEPTNQIAIPNEPKIQEERDLDATAVHEAVDPKLLQAMKGAASDGAIRAAAVVRSPEMPQPQASEPPPTRVAAFPTSEDGRSTREPPYLPVAVGVRVRLVADASGIRVVPDDGTIDGGTPAILVPVHADDDLRAVFSRVR